VNKEIEKERYVEREREKGSSIERRGEGIERHVERERKKHTVI
jgi:hypothetical protein